MKRVAVAAVLAGLLVTSGCIGFLTGSEALSFEARQVSVSADAKSETGYERTNGGSSTMNRSFAGRQVRVTNRFVELGRSADLPGVGDTKVARFTVFATPQVKIAGQTFNPIGKLNNTELVSRLQQQYGSLSNVRRVDERSDTVLGGETTVTKFRADAKMQGGREVEVFVHVTKVKHEGDFVVAVAVYPTKLDGEETKVDRLLAGIQHGS